MMNTRKIFLLLFFIVFIAELIGVATNNPTIEFIFKPLLLPALTAYFITAVLHKDRLIKWIIFALFFAWAGDVLLMFQRSNSVFFLLGLSAFLIAHIFYIMFFHWIRLREIVKAKPLLLLVVAVYYAILIYILSPHLGEMKLPVRVYGIVISFMFMLAMHMLFIKNRTAGMQMMIGALLFILSDSILALNKFYESFQGADMLVMLTYGLAQFFIVHGAIIYINASHPEEELLANNYQINSN